MPPNYRQQQGAPLLTHERRGIVVLVAAVVAAGVGLGVWGLTSTGGSGKGKCVSVLVASSTGGSELRHCGEAARSWCATQATSSGAVAEQAREACRRAGFVP